MAQDAANLSGVRVQAQGSKFKTNQYHKIHHQIFDMWCKTVRQMCQMSKKNFCHCLSLQSQAK